MTEDERAAARSRMKDRRVFIAAAKVEAQKISNPDRRRLEMEFERAAQEARSIVAGPKAAY